MSAELKGMQLARLEGPIRAALRAYQNISDGLVLDPDRACKLDLTPERPNSARSATDVLFQGVRIGDLRVIAFKQGDGTGSEVNYQLINLRVRKPYPREALVVPRNKDGIHTEVCLSVVRYEIEDPHADPKLFAGSFDLLGLAGNTVKKIGELGNPRGGEDKTPAVTATVGYKRGGERFGDPHAVFSSAVEVVQVCAFLAIIDEVHKQYPNILDNLNPQLPFAEKREIIIGGTYERLGVSGENYRVIGFPKDATGYETRGELYDPRKVAYEQLYDGQEPKGSLYNRDISEFNSAKCIAGTFIPLFRLIGKPPVTS